MVASRTGMVRWACAVGVVALVVAPLSGECRESKKKPSQAETWVGELVACADTNDGMCVEGLVDALKKYSKEACGLLAGSLGNVDRRAALVVESMVTLECPQTLSVAMDYFRKSESETRMEVFEAATLLRDKEILKDAEALLGGNRGYEKERVCFVLGRMRIPEALPLLLKATTDGMFSVRQQAAIAMGNYKGKEVTDTLCTLATTDANAGVRAQSAHALRQVGEWSTIPCLIKVLGDREPDVHYAAHEALKAVSGMDMGTRAGEWQDWWNNGAKKPQ